MKIADVKIDSMTFVRDARPSDDDQAGGDQFNVWFAGTFENGTTCHWGNELRTLNDDMELQTIVSDFLLSVLNHLYPNREG